jgi:integrase
MLNRWGKGLLVFYLHERSIWHMLKAYSRKIGLKVDRLNERGICAHSARVTAITAAFTGCAKLEEVQQLVGHKDARNTLRYRRATPKDAQNAILQIHYQ